MSGTLKTLTRSRVFPVRLHYADFRPTAVVTGAIVQFRFLGGAIGLAIGSSIMNSFLKVKLAGILSPGELAALLQSTEVLTTFRPEMQQRVREVFVQSYDIQFKVVTGIAAAQFPAAMLMWRSGNQIRAV